MKRKTGEGRQTAKKAKYDLEERSVPATESADTEVEMGEQAVNNSNIKQYAKMFKQKLKKAEFRKLLINLKERIFDMSVEDFENFLKDSYDQIIKELQQKFAVDVNDNSDKESFKLGRHLTDIYPEILAHSDFSGFLAGLISWDDTEQLFITDIFNNLNLHWVELSSTEQHYYFRDIYANAIQELIDDKNSFKVIRKKINTIYSRCENVEKFNNMKLNEFIKEFNDAYNKNCLPTMRLNWMNILEFIQEKWEELEEDSSLGYVEKGEIKVSEKKEYVGKICVDSPVNILEYMHRGLSKEAKVTVGDLIYSLRTCGECYEGWRSDERSSILIPKIMFVLANIPGRQVLDSTDYYHKDLKLHFLTFDLPKTRYNNKIILDKNDLFRDNADFDSSAKTDHAKGCEILEIEDRYGNLGSQEKYHSERVFVEYMKSNMYALLQLLSAEVRERFGSEGKYGLYSAVNLLYSSNTVCRNCLPALIASQDNDYEHSFFKKLKECLERNGNLNLQINDESRFKWQNIVVTRQNFPSDPQANDMTDDNKVSGRVNPQNHNRNPGAKLKLLDETLVLNKEEEIPEYTKPKFIYEFVCGEVSEPVEPPTSFVRGFISGSGSTHRSFMEVL